MPPLVSVVITTYNQGWCIHETLESVLNQTYRNLEIILVDDASTDGTAARVAKFGQAVRYFRHTTNLGRHSPAPTRNTGLRAARGEFIALMDGDDLWEPRKIAVQVEAALRHPRSGFVVVDGIRFNHHDGRTLNDQLFVDLDIPDGAEVTGSFYERLLKGCFIETPSQVLVPRSVFEAVGRFHNVWAEDYDFYLRVAARYEGTIVRKKLTRWRYRPTNRSGPLALQYLQCIPNTVDVRKKHLRIAAPAYRPLIRQSIRWDLCVVAHAAFEEGRRGKRLWATRYLLARSRQHLRLCPAILLLLARLWCPKWLASLIRSGGRLRLLLRGREPA